MFRLTLFLFLFVFSSAFAQPWKEHGPLKVSDNGHFLVHQDGHLFFWCGDTPWSLLSMDSLQVEDYLRDRASRHFNVVQVMAIRTSETPMFGFMTRPGFRGIYYMQSCNGEVPFSSIEPIALNEKYWGRLDYIIDKAAEYGIYVVPAVMWGRAAGKLFNDPMAGDRAFARKIASRYKDRPNVMWIAAGEFSTIYRDDNRDINEHDVELMNAIGEGLRADSEGKQLITIHGQPGWENMPSKYFQHADWLDFYMNQSWHKIGSIDSMSVHDWNLPNPKPTILGEAKYEGSYYPPYTKNTAKGDLVTDWHVRLQAYWAVFSGSFGHTYGALGLWNANGNLDQKILNYPGADDMQHLKALMETRPSLSRVYNNSFIKFDHPNGRFELNVVFGTWDETKSWAFAYTSKGDKFQVDLGRFHANTLGAKWYDPRLGVYQPICSFPAKGLQWFDPPGVQKKKVHKGSDWVLVLEKRGKTQECTGRA